MFVPQTQTQPVFETQPLESPFGWKSESFYLLKQVRLIEDFEHPSISFTATRLSKILDYIPFLGTIRGVSHIYWGIQESRYFDSIHLHSLSDRSWNWVKRGALIAFPVVGGLACIIADLIATILTKKDPKAPIKYENQNGPCHQCLAQFREQEDVLLD